MRQSSLAHCLCCSIGSVESFESFASINLLLRVVSICIRICNKLKYKIARKESVTKQMR
jgi:hypothetical protein